MNAQVKVVIPVYKAELTEYEAISIDRCRLILKNYPVVIVKPEHLDVSFICKRFGRDFEVLSFEDKYFDGIAGYNQLMVSDCFYKCFLDTEYILIYQLDAYVFRDELEYWCRKGYDYIGAPWIRKFKYHKWYHRLFWAAKKKICHGLGIRSYHDSFDKVGNGGFSLRKVRSHYRATLEMKNEIAEYLRKCKNKRFNEDIFWALEVSRKYPDFSIPLWEEALGFAFDVQVKECFYYSHNRLPFGIHGWYKRLSYYQKYIEEGQAL